jgi:hypothetical protein
MRYGLLFMVFILVLFALPAYVAGDSRDTSSTSRESINTSEDSGTADRTTYEEKTSREAPSTDEGSTTTSDQEKARIPSTPYQEKAPITPVSNPVTVYIPDITVLPGGDIELPLIVQFQEEVTKIGNIDITITTDKKYLDLVSDGGQIEASQNKDYLFIFDSTFLYGYGLPSSALYDSQVHIFPGPPEIEKAKISVVFPDGLGQVWFNPIALPGASGWWMKDRIVAILRYDVASDVELGATTNITIEEVSANSINGLNIYPTIEHGVVTINVQKGDCNKDGEVNSADALLAMKMAVGKKGEDLAACDVNGDGKVTSYDASEILKTAVGE